jgi:Acyl-CoA dehydrogenase, C-terminal domain
VSGLPGCSGKQPTFLVPVPQRPRRVQKLQFHDGACRYDACGKLVGPCLPELGLDHGHQNHLHSQCRYRRYRRCPYEISFAIKPQAAGPVRSCWSIRCRSRDGCRQPAVTSGMAGLRQARVSTAMIVGLGCRISGNPGPRHETPPARPGRDGPRARGGPSPEPALSPNPDIFQEGPVPLQNTAQAQPDPGSWAWQACNGSSWRRTRASGNGRKRPWEIAPSAVRIHAGYGYSTELDVERYFRDAPLMIVGEGTNELQPNVIARQLIQPAGGAGKPGGVDKEGGGC